MDWKGVLKKAPEEDDVYKWQDTEEQTVNPASIEKFANLVIDILEKKDIKSIYGDNIDEYIREGNFDMNNPKDIVRLSEGVNKENSKSWRDNLENFRERTGRWGMRVRGSQPKYEWKRKPASRFYGENVGNMDFNSPFHVKTFLKMMKVSGYDIDSFETTGLITEVSSGGHIPRYFPNPQYDYTDRIKEVIKILKNMNKPITQEIIMHQLDMEEDEWDEKYDKIIREESQ
tara:strand:- start:1979 stop:2668 length:690 start_codon:yes stop_codon:yes gene_type:complete